MSDEQSKLVFTWHRHHNANSFLHQPECATVLQLNTVTLASLLTVNPQNRVTIHIVDHRLCCVQQNVKRMTFYKLDVIHFSAKHCKFPNSITVTWHWF